MAEYNEVLRQTVECIVAATPVLELGLPEYCTFRDMYRYDPELLLCTACIGMSELCGIDY
jgi:hypothetical protein